MATVGKVRACRGEKISVELKEKLVGYAVQRLFSEGMYHVYLNCMCSSERCTAGAMALPSARPKPVRWAGQFAAAPPCGVQADYPEKRPVNPRGVGWGQVGGGPAHRTPRHALEECPRVTVQNGVGGAKKSRPPGSVPVQVLRAGSVYHGWAPVQHGEWTHSSGQGACAHQHIRQPQ